MGTSRRALSMSLLDDVATLIEPAAAGDLVCVETSDGGLFDELVALSDIPRFHKISLHNLAVGDVLHKYGRVIGCATTPVLRGEYAHTHNIASLKVGVRK